MDSKPEAIEAIRHYVWAGSYDPEEVVILVEESARVPGQLDQSWLRAEIEKEMVKKRAEEATWPATTDCDRLDRVFETLEEQGIIALQDAGYTKSDGIEEVMEVYEEAGEGARASWVTASTTARTSNMSCRAGTYGSPLATSTETTKRA